MYTPNAYREDRVDVMHAFLAANPLAAIATPSPDGVVVDHAPLVLLPGEGPNGTLIGHLARANPHLERLGTGTASVAIFQGAHAYVSPGWYPNKHETGRDVPTWNYVAVHAHGTIETFDDPDALLDMLERLTSRHEAGRADPWHVADAPADYIRQQLRGIVGLRMRIARLEGKWKLSQNREARDRAGAKAGLAASPDARDRAVAALMLD
jgi:transcriptional regulator